jgi:hypothetical protein
MIVSMNYEYRYYAISIFVYIFIFYFYYFNTKFTKEITVNKQYIEGHSKFLLNVISDTDNNVYTVDNKFLLLKFNSTENIAKLQSKKKYTIKGYGVRIPFLDLYPIILDVIEH